MTEFNPDVRVMITKACSTIRKKKAQELCLWIAALATIRPRWEYNRFAARIKGAVMVGRPIGYFDHSSISIKLRTMELLHMAEVADVLFVMILRDKERLGELKTAYPDVWVRSPRLTSDQICSEDGRSTGQHVPFPMYEAVRIEAITDVGFTQFNGYWFMAFKCSIKKGTTEYNRRSPRFRHQWFSIMDLAMDPSAEEVAYTIIGGKKKLGWMQELFRKAGKKPPRLPILFDPKDAPAKKKKRQQQAAQELKSKINPLDGTTYGPHEIASFKA